MSTTNTQLSANTLTFLRILFRYYSDIMRHEANMIYSSYDTKRSLKCSYNIKYKSASATKNMLWHCNKNIIELQRIQIPLNKVKFIVTDYKQPRKHYSNAIVELLFVG